MAGQSLVSAIATLSLPAAVTCSIDLVAALKKGLCAQRRLEHLAGDFCCYHPTYMEAHGVRKEQPYRITPRNESTLAIVQVSPPMGLSGPELISGCCMDSSAATERQCVVREPRCYESLATRCSVAESLGREVPLKLQGRDCVTAASLPLQEILDSEASDQFMGLAGDVITAATLGAVESPSHGRNGAGTSNAAQHKGSSSFAAASRAVANTREQAVTAALAREAVRKVEDPDSDLPEVDEAENPDSGAEPVQPMVAGGDNSADGKVAASASQTENKGDYGDELTVVRPSR